jgi:two-component system sensor histidine kinase/response regulator
VSCKRRMPSLLDTQFALDSVGIGITWADFATGRFIHANRFSAEFLGYSLDELLQLRVWDIDLNFPPEAFAQIARQIQKRGHLQFETEQLTKNNRRLPVEMNIYYHAGNGVTPPKLIAFMSDITRRKEAEAALRQAKEASEAASAAKSAFLANMSHEIRTPLNAIVGMNYLVRREPVSPLQAARLGKIDEAGQHLLAIINDVLDLSKIEAGQVQIENIEFDPSVVFDGVQSLIAEAVRAKGLTLQIDVSGVPRSLRGDPTRLRQALLNFAGNAVKFTDRGKHRSARAAAAGTGCRRTPSSASRSRTPASVISAEQAAAIVPGLRAGRTRPPRASTAAPGSAWRISAAPGRN